MTRLEDRVVVVTGGGSGLGLAYARRIAAAGGRVAIIDIDADAARTASEAIAAGAGEQRVMARAADVSDAAEVQSAVNDIIHNWSQIDALVNNAGGSMYPSTPVEAYSQEQWGRAIDVNLTSVWLFSCAVLPHMRAAGYGKIVNVSSTMVARAEPYGSAPYIAAKAGVVGLTRVLARELGKDGIRVNAIAPGYVPFPKRHSPRTAEANRVVQEQIRSAQCIQETLTPDDLAGTIEFLCSSDSDAITGQVLNLDNGWTHGGH